MWAHSTVRHKSPYLLSCQKTAFWRQLPFLFFRVQLFRVPFHTAPHPWTVKSENKQWPKKMNGSTCHLWLVKTSWTWSQPCKSNGFVCPLQTQSLKNSNREQTKLSPHLLAIPVALLHRHCSLRHVSENVMIKRFHSRYFNSYKKEDWASSQLLIKTWLVLPWKAHQQGTSQLSSTDRVTAWSAGEKGPQLMDSTL